jgi:virulence-associated protein VagC
MKLRFDWLPKEFELEEDSDHFLYLKHEGRIIAPFSQEISESQLKENVMNSEKSLIEEYIKKTKL